MNRKTIHRAYTRLAREGLLDPRPGSGTYIAESAPVNDLLGAVSRCRSAARELGLEAPVLASFLDIFLSAGWRGLPLAVVERDREHVGLIAASLHVELGIEPRPVLLSKFAQEPQYGVEGCSGVVTTDCLGAEIRSVLPTVPVFRVGLDPAFPAQLAERAMAGTVVMVVHDRAFGFAISRMLTEKGIAPEIISRFVFAEPAQAQATLQRAAGRTSVHVSPLFPSQFEYALPPHVGVIRGSWRLEPDSVERLKAALALEVASRRFATER
jgi:hypothetical protein